MLFGGPVYNLQDLGSVGTSTSAYGLSETGQAVGGGVDIHGNLVAFTSFGSGNGLLASAGGATAWAVNSAGTIAGTQYVNGEAYATTWSSGSPLIVGGAGSYSMGINESGQTTGMLTDNGQGRAYLMDPDGSLAGSMTLSGGWAAGYDVNDAGQVAGYGMTAGGAFRGFVWSGDDVTEFGTLGGANSYAMAVNSRGSVVGHAQAIDGFLHAVLWSSGGIVDLGTLGGSSSYAYGINDAGQVVGYAWTGGGMRAFLYANGVLTDLNALVDAGSGWTLMAAYDINNGGQIVGTGIYQGVEHAFRLDLAASGGDAGLAFTGATSAVPEPGTWGMVLVGIALCGVGMRRRAALRPALAHRTWVDRSLRSRLS